MKFDWISAVLLDCRDTNPRCRLLKLEIDGFCYNFDMQARMDCAATCGCGKFEIVD